MDRMNRKMFWTGGALMGAGLMALFDPNRGKGRRAVLRAPVRLGIRAVGRSWNLRCELGRLAHFPSSLRRARRFACTRPAASSRGS